MGFRDVELYDIDAFANENMEKGWDNDIELFESDADISVEESCAILEKEQDNDNAEKIISQYQAKEYCSTKCGYYKRCYGNADLCVKSAVEDVLKEFTAREQRIIRLKFGWFDNKEYDYQDISKILGLTENYTKQLVDKTIKKFCEQAESLKEYKYLSAVYTTNGEIFYLNVMNTIGGDQVFYENNSNSRLWTIDISIVDFNVNRNKSIPQIKAELNKGIDELAFLKEYSNELSRLEVQSLSQLLYISREALLSVAFDYDDYRLFCLESVLEKNGYRFKEDKNDFDKRLIKKLKDVLIDENSFNALLVDSPLPLKLVSELLTSKDFTNCETVGKLIKRAAVSYGKLCINLSRFCNFLLRQIEDESCLFELQDAAKTIEEYLDELNLLVTIGQIKFVITPSFFARFIADKIDQIYEHGYSVKSIIDEVNNSDKPSINVLLEILASKEIISILDYPLSVLWIDNRIYFSLKVSTIFTFRDSIEKSLILKQKDIHLAVMINSFLEKYGYSIMEASELENIQANWQTRIQVCNLSDIPIEEFGLPMETYTYLKQMGLNYAYDIVQSRNYLEKAILEQITTKLDNVGLSFEQLARDTVETLEIPIEALDLSVMAFERLKRAGINTIQDLIEMSEYGVVQVQHMERKSLEEIQHKLRCMGLSLRNDNIGE